jgi:preprotein translocase subunit SecY
VGAALVRAELARRIAFTLGALVVYRVGTYIPLPGIDPIFLEQQFHTYPLSILGIDVFAGGNIHRLSIFSISIIPYISTAVLVQLFILVFGMRRRFHSRGERGSRTIERVTLGLTALSVMLQSLGIAEAFESYGNVVSEPGGLFLLSTVATLTGGVFFLIWLSRQITLRGIGNGLALILFAGIVPEVPFSIAGVLEFVRQGVFDSNRVLELLFVVAAVVALIAVMESARRRVPIEYAGRQVGSHTIGPRTSDLSLKLNNAGIIPFVVATWLYGEVWTLAQLFVAPGSWVAAIAEQLGHGRIGYAIFIVLATVLLALIYTALILDPRETAQKLERFGGSISGVGSGEATAEHIDFILSRTALVGAIYLAFICLIPEMLIAYAQVPFYFGGVPALIVVSTVLDIDQQIRVDGLG